MIEILSLIISILAFIFSIVSLILSHRWNDLKWQRDTWLPFYKKLNKLIDYAYDTFIEGTLGVYRHPDCADYINEAKTLGIEEAQEHLERFQHMVDKARQESDNWARVAPKDTHLELEDAILALKYWVEKDIARITKKRPLRVTIGTFFRREYW